MEKINGVCYGDLWNIEALEKRGFDIESAVIDGQRKKVIVNRRFTNRLIIAKETAYYDEIGVNPGQGVYVKSRGSVLRRTEYGFVKL